MLLKTKVDNCSIDIRIDHPGHTDWIFGCYIKECRIKVKADTKMCEEEIEKTKCSLNKSFGLFADYRNVNQEGDGVVFTFQFKESIGIPFVEAFEDLIRRQAKWVLEALNQTMDCCSKNTFQVELVLEGVYSVSKIMK